MTDFTWLTAVWMVFVICSSFCEFVVSFRVDSDEKSQTSGFVMQSRDTCKITHARKHLLCDRTKLPGLAASSARSELETAPGSSSTDFISVLGHAASKKPANKRQAKENYWKIITEKWRAKLSERFQGQFKKYFFIFSKIDFYTD